MTRKNKKPPKPMKRPMKGGKGNDMVAPVSRSGSEDKMIGGVGVGE